LAMKCVIHRDLRLPWWSMASSRSLIE
jgi:hypothetical protein